jgi:hypothetical protein
MEYIKMADLIFVKVAPVPDAVKEIMIPADSTVAFAINYAKINASNYDAIHMNGEPAKMSDYVVPGAVIVLTPRIRGGKDNI